MGNRIVRFVKSRLKENYDANRAFPVDQPGGDGGIRAGVKPDGNSVKQHDRVTDHGAAFWFWWIDRFADDVEMDGTEIRGWGSD